MKSVSYCARERNVDRNTSSATNMNIALDMQAAMLFPVPASLNSRALRICTMLLLQGIFTPVILGAIRGETNTILLTRSRTVAGVRNDIV